MQGENAEKHPGREYWSRRHGETPWGKIGKWLTHRKERAGKRRIEYQAKLTGDEERCR